MADNNPNKIIEGLTKKPVRITNATNPNADAPKLDVKRYTKRPSFKDYNLTDEQIKSVQDLEYYSHINDYDKELADYQEKLKKTPDSPYFQRKVGVLTNPSIASYIRNRNAFNKQFEDDYNAYKDTAKQEIINKLLGDGDLYNTHYFGKDHKAPTDDLYDSINQAFAKKYGYEDSSYNDLFSPGRNSLADYLGDEEDLPELNGYRRKYNKDKYIGDMLDKGIISVSDLRNYWSQPQQPKSQIGVGYRGVGNFIRKPLPGELPGSDSYNKNGSSFQIEHVVNLSPQQLKQFANAPLDDYDYIGKVAKSLSSSPDGVGTILLDDGQSEYGFVVDPSGYSYGRYVFPIKLR